MSLMFFVKVLRVVKRSCFKIRTSHNPDSIRESATVVEPIDITWHDSDCFECS